VLAILMAIGCGVVPAGAQAAEGAGSGAGDSASRWIDSIFAPFATRRSPGCAVGVTRDGALAFAKGYGMADLEHQTPINPDTRFYIASLSKQFTAMSIVLLAQEGLLSLDDSIRKWVPEVPSLGATITLRQLLHHTSGLRDYFTLLAVSGWPSDGQLTDRQFLDLMSRQKNLNFAPGDEFLYSNTGYALLSIVVKRAAGQSLREFAAERIFKPLGMTHTEFRDDHLLPIPQRALGYQPKASGYRVSQPEFDVVGDGGMYSTIGDLAKWDANFGTGQVGGKAGIAQLEEPGRLNNGQTIPYGLALSIGTIKGVKTYGHSGAYGGYRSTLLRFPDRYLSVITLCNTSSASWTLAEQVGTVLLGLATQRMAATTLDLAATQWAAGTAQAPPDSTNARRRNDQLAEIAGGYYSDELDLRVALVVRDGILVLERPHADDIRFVPFTDDLFTNSDKMLLRVVRNDRGRVTGFRLTISRVRDLEFRRREGRSGNKGRD
jgi:CubicO group peptidase (beta-lactamase class C family)